MEFSEKLINILYVEDEEDLREVITAVILKDVEAQVSTIASDNLAGI